MNKTATLSHILAQQPNTREAVVKVDEPELKLVIFRLGKEHFAFDGRWIREIMVQQTVHFVPGCPPSLAGVINVRGDIESVLTLHVLLQLASTADSKPGSSTILLGVSPALRTGIAVDAVVDVIDLPLSLLRPPPANFTEALRSLTSAVFEYQQRPVSLLDFERLCANWLQALE